MKTKTRNSFWAAACLFLLSGIFTIIVSSVDVQPIGPEGTSVGLAALNQFIANCLGVHPLWYEITDWLGIIALLFASGFALLGAAQLIHRKSLRKVDKHLVLLGLFYMMVTAVYLFFECVIINYRPVIIHTEPEASYPSSHTMIVLCIMSTAMMEFRILLVNHRSLRLLLNIISIFIMTITVIGRMLSGVHWFTDIVAGILFASALIMLYHSLITHISEERT